jgi:hypothetical protein
MKTQTKKVLTIEHEFVEFIPNELERGKIYVSVAYATAAHACFCGCGTKVVTPINPTGWQLMFDGDTVSLRPSIGNWGFRCRSHYWVTRNQVVWARRMSKEAIERGRRRDKEDTDVYFGIKSPTTVNRPARPVKPKIKHLLDWILGRP